VAGGQLPADVEGLDRPFSVDIIRKDNIPDVSINNQRTLVNWVPNLSGDRVILFTDKGEASVSEITASPLR
jgi:hypothetical protein